MQAHFFQCNVTLSNTWVSAALLENSWDALGRSGSVLGHTWGILRRALAHMRLPKQCTPFIFLIFVDYAETCQHLRMHGSHTGS